MHNIQKNSHQSTRTHDVRKYLHRPKRMPVRTILVILVLYLVFTQPFIALFFFPPIVYSGTYLYDTRLYRLFNQSRILELAVSSLPNCQEAEVTHFSYHDHLLRDSIFYGKFCDLFIVELAFDEQYETVKQYVVQNSDESLVIDECELFSLQCAMPNKKATFCVTFLDQNSVCRCILITDCEEHEPLLSVDAILLQSFGIDWTEDSLSK